MRFSVRFILFGVMPYLAIMAAVGGWMGRGVTLIVGYYFTFIWWGVYVATTQRRADARSQTSRAADEV